MTAMIEEIVFGRLNFIFFAVGIPLNSLVFWIKCRDIKTPVDVCVLLITISNWVTLFLDLFLGIHNLNASTRQEEDNSSPFDNFEFTQFWGFVKMTNWEWMCALVALLTLSNIALQSRRQAVALALAWLVVECALLSLPLIHGSRFSSFLFVPMMFHGDMLGNDMTSPKFLSWVYLVELLPYTYFILVTVSLLIVNCFNYTLMKQGHRPSSAKKVLDTKVVIALSSVYLLSEVPALMLSMLMIFLFTLTHYTELLLIGFNLYMWHLFMATCRSAATPIGFLLANYGFGVFTKPVRAVVARCQTKVQYRKFRDEQHMMSLTEVEDTEAEPCTGNGDP